MLIQREGPSSLSRVIWTGLSWRGVGRVANFGIVVGLARFLGPADLGIFAIVVAVGRVCGELGCFGGEVLVLRCGTALLALSPQGLRRIAGSLLLRAAVVSGVLFILLEMAAPFLGPAVGVPVAQAAVFRTGCLLVPLIAVGKVLGAATQCGMSVRWRVFGEEVVQPGSFMLFVGAGIALGRLDLMSAVQAYVMSFLVCSVVMWCGVVRLAGDATVATPGAGDPGTFDRISFGSGAAIAMSVLAGNALHWGDRLVVGGTATPDAVGQYQAAAQLAGVFALIGTAVNGAALPFIARAINDGSKARAEDSYRTAVFMTMLVAGPVLAIMLVLRRDVTLLLFGPRFAMASVLLIPLACAQAINAITGPAVMTLQVAGQERIWTAVVMSFAMFAVALEAMLGLKGGPVGVAVGSALGTSGMFAVAVYMLWRREGIRPWGLREVYIAAASAAVGLAVHYARNNGWLGLA